MPRPPAPPNLPPGVRRLGERMFTFRVLASFGTANDPWSMTSVFLPYTAGGRSLVLAGGGATGHYNLLDLTTGTAVLRGRTDLGGVTISDAALLQGDGTPTVYTASQTGNSLVLHDLDSAGGLSALAPLARVGGVQMEVSVLEAIRLGGVDYLALAARDVAGLTLIRLPATGGAELVGQIQDGPKVTLSGISDMVSLTLGGEIYLIAASSSRDGLTSFHLGAGGSLTVADSLTAKDGLWVAGLDVLAVAETGGHSFVIAGSTQTGSLSVLRINDLGVMFVTDQIHDDLTTRFGAVSEIATVTVGGRVLVVAGGGDGGISLLELLPDGRLFHHAAYEAESRSAAIAGGLTGLSVVVAGDGLQILAGGPGGVVQIQVPLADLGPAWLGTPGADTLTGGAGDDLIFGNGGADRLSGGAGDDLIFALAAGTTMTGGAGADIFHPGPGTATSTIRDFEPGTDRLDLSDWGRLYDPSALTILSRSDGAEIRYGDNVLRIYSADGSAIMPSEWGADDFLF